jgi:hypothetical protein
MKSFVRTAVFAAAVLLPTAALAQDAFRVTIGLTAWVHTWSTWTGSGSGAVPSAAVGQTETDTETVLVPSVTMRFHNFFVSGDIFPEKEYDFLTDYRGIKREEWSIVGGYYIAPQLAVALGYKRIHQDFRQGSASGFDMNIDIPMFGLQGGAPVGESGNWFIYGNGFLGPISVKSAGAGTSTDYEGWYYSTELGLGYRLFQRMSATLGYKYQTVRWEEIEGKVPGYDYTMGWIVGLSFTF